MKIAFFDIQGWEKKHIDKELTGHKVLLFKESLTVDTAKAAKVIPFMAQLNKLNLQEPSPECRKLLKEYRKMLAEFKISVFAQEMKTLFPVSPKRLNKKWQEIINSC